MRQSVQMPAPLKKVFAGKGRYRCAYGGRGSGKSVNFAMMLALRGYEKPLRILCCREIQLTLEDSSKHELEEAIRSMPFLEEHYEIGKSFITGKNGTEFIFRGLFRNQRGIKSLAKVDICWVEEAETVTKESWDLLKPTIRRPGSEIWVTWNPEDENAPCQKMFIDAPDERMRVVKLNWRDNPWFPEELEYERLRCLENDPDSYDHIWEGKCQTRTDAQIFSGHWRMEEFRPDPKKWNGPYYGLDFGFSQDPTACVQCWSFGDVLYVHREAGQIQLDLDRTVPFLIRNMKQIQNFPVRCDNARPESISYLKQHGLPRARPVVKWSGSVEDGIEWIKAHKSLVVHPRCKKVMKELKLYHYKIDKATGEPTGIIVDANNHYIDAIRYAFQPLIKKTSIDYSKLGA